MSDNVAIGRITSYVTIVVPTRGQLGPCPNDPACSPSLDSELPAVALVAPPDDPNEWWARWPA